MWNTDRKKAVEFEKLVNTSVFKTGQDLEMEELFSVVGSLKTLPKKELPGFAMKRRYLLAEHEAHVQKGKFLIGFSKVFAGTAVAFMVLFVVAVGYADSQILPGNALFAWKLGVEHTRLALSGSGSGRAELSLRYTEKRLFEAQRVFANPGSTLQDQAAALSVLASQTQDTIALVTKPEVVKNTPELLDKLAMVTEGQVSLLNSSKQDQSTPEAETALVAAKQAAKSVGLTKLIVAATSEGDLSSLGIVAEELSGKISEVGEGYIILDTLELEINLFEGTNVVFEDENTKELQVGQVVKAAVDFNSKKTSALARSITVVKTEVPKAQVKPATTEEGVDGEVEVPAGKVEEQDAPVDTEPEQQVDRVSTGFRVESPIYTPSVTD